MTTYKQVNAMWPDPVPVPTSQEAISGVKRLLRRAHRLAVEDGAVPSFAKLRHYRFRATSGRRRSWPRRGVWAVNPNECRRGWAEIVHSVSHWARMHYWPQADGHGALHAWLENELARYAVSNLIDGQLRRPEKVKAKPDPVQVRSAHVDESIKKWEAKLRRAENALRKLRRKRSYYERRPGHTGVSTTAPGDA